MALPQFTIRIDSATPEVTYFAMFTFALAPCPHIVIAIPFQVSFVLRLLHVVIASRPAVSMMSELGNGGACVAIAMRGGLAHENTLRRDES